MQFAQWTCPGVTLYDAIVYDKIRQKVREIGQC